MGGAKREQRRQQAIIALPLLEPVRGEQIVPRLLVEGEQLHAFSQIDGRRCQFKRMDPAEHRLRPRLLAAASRMLVTIELRKDNGGENDRHVRARELRAPVDLIEEAVVQQNVGIDEDEREHGSILRERSPQGH